MVERISFKKPLLSSADLRNESSWLKLPEGEEFCIELVLSKFSKSHSIYAQAPRYPKPVMEGYFLLLGNGDELVGLKRVNQVRGFSRFLTPLGRNFFKREKQIK